MEKDILHILNGDVTLEKFKESAIGGHTMVWRETLSLGPLFYQVDSEIFWEMRSQFIEKAYGSKLSQYKSKVIKEFQKLKKFKGKEIVLWFEYDFFCQINMIALLSYLLRYKKSATISLIEIGDVPGFEKRVGLGEVPTSLYQGFYKDRKVLTREELIIADKAWMIYCSNSWNEIESLNFESFPYLEEGLRNAKKVHYKPNEVSELELAILKILSESDTNKHLLIGRLLKTFPELGLGDLQYEYLIKNLKHLTTQKGESLSLNSKGKSILSKMI